MSDSEAKYRIELIEKTFAILESFDPASRELSGRDIVRATGQTQSSVYRILANLTRLGMLDQDPATRRYRIGPKLHAIGSLAVLDIRTRAMPYMDDLRRELGLTVSISTHDGMVGTLVEVLESREPYGISLAVGTREPTHCTASGKCALAFGSPYDREAFLATDDLRPYTPATVTRRRDLLDVLEAVRAAGYAVDKGEWAPHVQCVAAPLFDRTQRFCGALSLSWPLAAPATPEVDEVLDALLVAAEQLSTELGYTGSYPATAKNGSPRARDPEPVSGGD